MKNEYCCQLVLRRTHHSTIAPASIAVYQRRWVSDSDFLTEDLAAEFRPRISGTVHSGVYAEHSSGSESSLHPGVSFTPHYTETSPNVEDTHSAGFRDDDWTSRQAARLGQGEGGQTHQNQAPHWYLFATRSTLEVP